MFSPVHHDIHRSDETDQAGHGPAHGRSRAWERRHLDEKVVYRGVNPGYVQEVRRLASDLLVPQGEVARSLMEYSLHRYEEGFLDLVPRLDPVRMRMTLRPPTQRDREKTMKRKSKSPTQPETSWRQTTTWRNFPPKLKRTISALASEEALNIPMGELVNALLRHALQAHQAGLLKLAPLEKVAAS